MKALCCFSFASGSYEQWGALLLPEATCGQLPSEPAGAAHLITRLGLFPLIWKPALPLPWFGPRGALCSCYFWYGLKILKAVPVLDLWLMFTVTQESAKIFVHDFGSENRSDRQKSPRKKSGEVFSFLFFSNLFLLVFRESFCLSRRKTWICGLLTHVCKAAKLAPLCTTGLRTCGWLQWNTSFRSPCLSSAFPNNYDWYFVESVEVFRRWKSLTMISDHRFKAGSSVSLWGFPLLT